MSERSDYLTLQQFVDQLKKLPPGLETKSLAVTYHIVKFPTANTQTYNKCTFNKPWNCVELDFEKADDSDDDDDSDDESDDEPDNITVYKLLDQLHPALAKNPKAAVLVDGHLVSDVEKPMLKINTKMYTMLYETKMNTTPAQLTIIEFVKLLNQLQIRNVDTAVALGKEKINPTNLCCVYLIDNHWYSASEVQQLIPKLDLMYTNGSMFKLEHDSNTVMVYTSDWTRDEMIEKFGLFASADYPRGSLPNMPLFPIASSSLPGLPITQSVCGNSKETPSLPYIEKDPNGQVQLQVTSIHDKQGYYKSVQYGFIISQDHDSQLYVVGIDDNGIRQLTDKEKELAKKLRLSIPESASENAI